MNVIAKRLFLSLLTAALVFFVAFGQANAEEKPWHGYNLIPWNGAELTNGTLIILSTIHYDDGFPNNCKGRISLSSYVSIISWQWNSSYSKYDYLTASQSETESRAVFKVTTWPRVPGECMPDNSPNKYQKVILQGPSGKYITTDFTGVYTVSAEQDNALVFSLDLTRTPQVLFYHLFYKYGQRASMDPVLNSVFPKGAFTLNAARPSPTQPIFFISEQGIGESGILNLFVLKLISVSNGMRVRDMVTGSIYLMIDGKLRVIPNTATFNKLFKDRTSVIDITTAGIYPVGQPVTDGAYVGTSGTDGKVYLVIDGKKRLIPNNTDVFKTYGFTVRYVPAAQLKAISDGANVTLP